MEIKEIEDKIAQNEMSAAQVFTQMKQHVPSEEPVYFFSANYVSNGKSKFSWAQRSMDKNMDSGEIMGLFLDELKDHYDAEGIHVIAFNRC